MNLLNYMWIFRK